MAKILICDDDTSALGLLKSVLEDEGHNVICCSSGWDAVLALCSPHPPRLAILDWTLPDYSGIEICRRVREQNNMISLHIIMLTTRHATSDLEEALSAGANDFMTKPFQRAELCARVDLGLKIITLQNELKTLSGRLPVAPSARR